MISFLKADIQNFFMVRPNRLTLQKVLFFCLTFFFLSIAGASRYVLAPYLLKIPADFRDNADVLSLDNFYDLETGAYKGEQLSSTVFGYAVSSQGKNLGIDNFFTVSTLQGQPIFETKRTYGVEPWSGKHVYGVGDRDRDGYLFAPRMKGPAAQVEDKSTFTYWHVNYDAPALLQFQSEEILHGLTVYHYEANYFADQTKELTGVLPGVGSETGISLDIKLQLWVEPYTGRLVQYKDTSEAYYYSLETKQRLHPWNNFSNRFSPRSVAEHVTYASILKQKLVVTGVLVPLVFTLFAVIVFALFLLQIHFFRKLFLKVPFGIRVLFLPLSVGLLTLVATFSFAYLFQQVLQQQTKSELTAEIEATNELIVSKLHTYTSLLKGGAGLVQGSSSVSRQEWRKYIDSLDIHQQFPGVQGVGLSVLVRPEEVSSFEKSVQAEGFTDFRITPAGERELYSPILYLEPFDERNQRAFGYDMLSEPVRRAAMNYARDSGQPALSGKVTLKQENDIDIQAGFLLYEPLYKQSSPSATVQERREALYGYVYSPFRAKDFMRRVLLNSGTNLFISLYDTTNPDDITSTTLLFTNKLLDQEVAFEVPAQISYGGKTWTVVYHVPPSYGQSYIETTMLYILRFFGVALSGALAVIIYILHVRRENAVAYAARVTKDLHRAKEKAESLRQEAEEQFVEADRFNKLMVDRELRMVELKEQIKQLQKDAHDSTSK
jgi:CHASE1-domain containing sensor protein